ncbi:probable 1-acyl-sn-glycerol-3-phosphate acyltransferase 4 isoform X2 [Abrus precatorius]|uniref:1-acylglycerol-3-phosphate O-acyltransferase n=1 Tax=Abrus precatorius TaxID=3816 RepID=A0A8B8JG01_ABRPR|nr:probable 1-acyl-sn-glycerol-3-phosphate acyltransferase 4 isoform X2 [Abrus precatorius]
MLSLFFSLLFFASPCASPLLILTLPYTNFRFAFPVSFIIQLFFYKHNLQPIHISESPLHEGRFFNSFLKKMEGSSPVKSESRLKHRPLTPFRFLRGLICLVVFLSTAFMCLVYFTPVAVVGLRLFSIRCSRKTVSFIFGLWLALWPSLFEKINKTKVVFSGDSIPMKERVLLIANHRTEVDWMYLWDLALRKGRLGCIKYILKSSLMKLPIFGWGFHILEFIAVERKWEIDEQILHQKLSTLKDPHDPLWLAIFPEGTDYTEKKSKDGKKFAAEAGLPVLTNVLLPKTKGFHACLEVLRGSLDAVYDVTIAYKNHCPSFLDNVFGVDPSEVHLHIRRIPAEEIPASETKAASWLINTFQIKDQLLSDFKIQDRTRKIKGTILQLVFVGKSVFDNCFPMAYFINDY